MPHLTPEFFLRLYSGSHAPTDSLGQLVRHALTTSEETRQCCAHLLPLFGDEATDVRYWDLYLAHFRWAGERQWRVAQEEAPEGLDAALMRLPEEPSPLDWGLVEAVCESSRRLAASDQKCALRLAHAALNRARRAPVDVLGKGCRHELRALAWATLANAHRAHDQLEEARKAMAKATRQLERGRPHLLGLAPAVLSFRADLEFWEHQPQASLDTLAQALAMKPADTLRARLLVKRSSRLIAVGDSLAALESLREAVPLIDRLGEPRLWYCVIQHQLFILTEMGRFDEAGRLLPEVQGLVAAGNTPIHQTHVHWIEARMASGLGDPQTAETLYLEVRQEFLTQGLAYRAAIVTLELAELLLPQGRLEEVRRLATGTLEEFQRQGVESRFISALALVEQAVIGQRLTVEILRKARALVERR